MQDRDGWNAMVAASKKGQNGIVKLLKESNAYLEHDSVYKKKNSGSEQDHSSIFTTHLILLL